MNVRELCEDLRAERSALEDVLDGLDDAAWSTPTPAAGWEVVDQVTHLARFDDTSTLSITDPGAFRLERAEAVRDVDGFVARVVAEHHTTPPAEALGWLHAAGERFTRTAEAADPAVRVPWYGSDMTIASMVTARIMETWAHGRDVRDALGVAHPSSVGLRHVAFLGWRAVANSFRAHGRPEPTVPVRVELDDPVVGAVALGAVDADDVVRGDLGEFCLVVTQRRHIDDTALSAEGPVAREWLTIAQAFAGPPGAGRRAGQLG